MPGRKPKPANLLTLEKGTLYGVQRERVENEPRAERHIVPKCPARFSREEKREWRFFASILKNYGLLTIANAPILELLATDMAQYKECAAKVAETGIIIRSPQNFPIYNPYWTAVNKLEEKIHKCLAELGLSSSSLARIGALIVKSSKEKDGYFED